MTATTTPSRQLFSVKEFARRHRGCLTEGALRALIFHNRNGFADKSVRRLGRKVVIDEAAFFEWLDERSGHVAGAGEED